MISVPAVVMYDSAEILRDAPRGRQRIRRVELTPNLQSSIAVLVQNRPLQMHNYQLKGGLVAWTLSTSSSLQSRCDTCTGSETLQEAEDLNLPEHDSECTQRGIASAALERALAPHRVLRAICWCCARAIAQWPAFLLQAHLQNVSHEDHACALELFQMTAQQPQASGPSPASSPLSDRARMANARWPMPICRDLCRPAEPALTDAEACHRS